MGPAALKKLEQDQSFLSVTCFCYQIIIFYYFFLLNMEQEKQGESPTPAALQIETSF